jgi:glutaminyl-tRNA synthetase
MRRRGYPPGAIRTFCERIGVGKRENLVDMALLDYCVREELNRDAPRVMAVLRPLKVVITNLPEGHREVMTVPNHPKDADLGIRSVPFSREILIDRNDFAEVPPKGFKRLVPGGEVRLRNAYVIRCDAVIKDGVGEVVELRATADLATLGRNPEGRKVAGVIHWVSASQGVRAEVRLYDRLFRVPDPGAGGRDFLADINPESLVVLGDAMLEPSLLGVQPGQRFQFEREGYFVADLDSTPERPIFNLTVGLRDTWGKAQFRGPVPESPAGAWMN